jgi:hypothetical protein
LLGLNSSGQPWITWSTGPNGVRVYGTSKLAQKAEGPLPEAAGPPPTEPAALYAPVALETVDDVIALGSGPGTERFQGVLDNVIVFRIIRDQL